MKFKIVESFEKEKYIYCGPIFNSNDSEISPESIYVTYAKSFAEAKRNILYQIRRDIGEGFIDDYFLRKAAKNITHNNNANKNSDDDYDKDQLSFF